MNNRIRQPALAFCPITDVVSLAINLPGQTFKSFAILSARLATGTEVVMITGTICNIQGCVTLLFADRPKELLTNGRIFKGAIENRS